MTLSNSSAAATSLARTATSLVLLLSLAALPMPSAQESSSTPVETSETDGPVIEPASGPLAELVIAIPSSIHPPGLVELINNRVSLNVSQAFIRVLDSEKYTALLVEHLQSKMLLYKELPNLQSSDDETSQYDSHTVMPAHIWTSDGLHMGLEAVERGIASLDLPQNQSLADQGMDHILQARTDRDKEDKYKDIERLLKEVSPEADQMLTRKKVREAAATEEPLPISMAEAVALLVLTVIAAFIGGVWLGKRGSKTNKPSKETLKQLAKMMTKESSVKDEVKPGSPALTEKPLKATSSPQLVSTAINTASVETTSAD